MSVRRALDWKQLKLYSAALLFAGLSNVAFAGDASKPPIVLESTGGYEVGGKVIDRKSVV